ILVLVVRPVVAFAASARTDLSQGERAFIGWMDPRGIVAAATASAFSAGLVDRGVSGAARILPVTFLVIVGTVLLYALTAAPVARRLRVVKRAGTR
ncbi:cation:proton antiporter, partial [Streptomyces brasiliscabiei]